MTLPAISDAPDPPLVTDDQDTFNEKAFNFIAYIAGMPTEYNALADAMEALAQLLFRSTSTTSNTIAGTGTKNFTVETGRAFVPGQWIIASRTAAPSTTYMRGQVSSYNPDTGALSIAVAASGGSGTYTDWSIGLIPDPATIAAYLALAGGTMTGLLATVASATGGAGFRLPHGAAPTSPTNGDKWTTTTGEFTRLNGATKQVMMIDGTLLGFKETTYTITDGAAFEIDPANGSIQTITLGAARTPKGTNIAAGQSILLGIDDGTAYTINWTDTTFGASGVKWMDGSTPALATSGLTWVTLWKVGSQVYGAIAGASA